MNVRYSKEALKQLKKLDKPTAKTIVEYMQGIEKLKNPRDRGKQLSGDLAEFWRYRMGNYRILCRIQDRELVILVVEIGHRKDVYN